MLRVKTRLAMSSIHGIGLFADEPIAAGAVIWQHDARVDLVLGAEELAALPEPARQQLDRYTYFEKELGAYVLCADDARFMNHSPTPNSRDIDGMRTIATRDIAAGEEITCDYAVFDADSGLS